MDVRQVNTRVGHIARWQACLGGFMESPSPSLEASEDKDDDSDSNDEDDDEDEDANLIYLHIFWYESSHVHRGELV